ncbi:hypothetical protein [Alteromonas sp. RKMC-009]|uniref:hypothetical protein n=1 Tax=Alteromonas sp. RKMC-009 TaxID=2267264 RepID=UPI000E69A4DC|nr:hypothetical protein [Alteromonas sp. RKMC-009]AYA64325.1 hypothetical protein DS731_10125 [Alteromonas sp. RKMC-009]
MTQNTTAYNLALNLQSQLDNAKAQNEQMFQALERLATKAGVTEPAGIDSLVSQIEACILPAGQSSPPKGEKTK